MNQGREHNHAVSKSPAGTVSMYPQGGQRKSVSGIIGEGEAARHAQARGARMRNPEISSAEVASGMSCPVPARFSSACTQFLQARLVADEEYFRAREYLRNEVVTLLKPAHELFALEYCRRYLAAQAFLGL